MAEKKQKTNTPQRPGAGIEPPSKGVPTKHGKTSTDLWFGECFTELSYLLCFIEHVLKSSHLSIVSWLLGNSTTRQKAPKFRCKSRLDPILFSTNCHRDGRSRSISPYRVHPGSRWFLVVPGIIISMISCIILYFACSS